MPGLRQRKRLRTERDILGSAEHLFAASGYHETTMEAIAERAEVGVGTLYNYFGSKIELLFALFSRDVAELRKEGESVLGGLTPADDASDAVMRLFRVYLRGLTRLRRDLLLKVCTASMQRPASLGQSALDMDWSLVAQTGELLHGLAERGRLRSDLPMETAALTLYSVLGGLLLLFAMSESVSGEELDRMLQDHVKLVIVDWRPTECRGCDVAP